MLLLVKCKDAYRLSFGFVRTVFLFQDCMVVVGGRLSIPANEPIPVTCDLMTKAVEILWWKPPPQQQQATGKAQMLKVRSVS